MSQATEDTLRRLTLGDERMLASIESGPGVHVGPCTLDPRTSALVRLGALVALDAAGASYQREVDLALAAGATVEEIVAVLTAVAPAAGSARVMSAAPRVALAVGYDVEAALERRDDPMPSGRNGA